MNARVGVAPEVQSLIEAVCDGVADDVQMRSLKPLLLTDEAARAFYVDLLNLDAELHWLVGSLEGGKAARKGFTAPEQTPLQRPVPSFPATLGHGTVDCFSSGWPVAYLVATVVFGIGLAIGAFTYVSHPGNLVVGGQWPVVNKSNSQSIIPNPSPKAPFVGRITGMVDCPWGGGARVSLGQKYELTSGLMEITYDSGARVILQGPVTYEVESRDGGFLSVGKLTARLEKSEVGGQRSQSENHQSDIIHQKFVVRTPTATVTDLGTEFGVEVDTKGTTTSHVFRGKVRFRSVNDGKGIGDVLTLNANESARTHVDSNNNVVAAVLRDVTYSNTFIRTIPNSTSPYSEKNARQKASDAYAELVLSMQPVAYYRMERPEYKKDQYTLFDSTVEKRNGAVHIGAATGMLWLPGHSGDSLRLRGDMVGDYAVVSDYPQTRNNELTVTVWVFSESCLPWATIAKNWGNSKHGQFHLGLAKDGEDLHAILSQADGTWIEVREGADTPLPSGVWQHVAMVADGKMVRLYRNGKEVAAALCNGLKYPSPMPALGIGCKLDDDGVRPDEVNPGYWRGRIDELAIFHRALTPKTIQRLYVQDKTKVDSGQKTSVKRR